MNDIQIFNNPTFGEIRTIVLDGQPWFVGRDVAKALGYARPDNAVTTHCKHSLKQGVPSLQSSDKEVEATVIPEGDMYRLISKSKLKSAEQFEEWVFDEVLPTIRKTGSYGQPQTLQGQIQLLAKGTDELYQRVDAVTEDVKSVRQEIETLKDDLPLFPSEADEVKNAINRKVVSLLGGKDSNAYRNNSLTKKMFIDCYRTVKHNFGDINTYKALKRGQKERALRVIEEYKPPVFLAEQIETVNAQQRLDVWEVEG